ncbi:phosphatidylinositol 3-kinase regulatory subunit beta-like [Lytechinus pictus]|uniref:phosphatidylinositol 3-kinase regulatory subunit beta-like n=1 Tax=Lytechinus pictus TaxID=7653 RepID=UPI0030B9EBB6
MRKRWEERNKEYEKEKRKEKKKKKRKKMNMEKQKKKKKRRKKEVEKKEVERGGGGESPDQGRLLPGQQELLADILQKESVRKMNHGKPVGTRRGSLPGLHFSGQATPGRRRGNSFTDGQHQYTDNAYYKFLPDDIAFSQVLPPVWFLGKISRSKAEEILHQSTSNGDLLLRESEAHPGQYTLSVRQDTDNKSLIRHYMFKKNPFGFILLIEDKPPVLGSMYELMWFFIQESGGHLLPIQKNPNLPSTIYDFSVPTPQCKYN